MNTPTLSTRRQNASFQIDLVTRVCSLRGKSQYLNCTQYMPFTLLLFFESNCFFRVSAAINARAANDKITRRSCTLYPQGGATIEDSLLWNSCENFTYLDTKVNMSLF